MALFPPITLSPHTLCLSLSEDPARSRGGDNVEQISSCGRQMLPLRPLALHKSYDTLSLDASPERAEVGWPRQRRAVTRRCLGCTTWRHTKSSPLWEEDAVAAT